MPLRFRLVAFVPFLLTLAGCPVWNGDGGGGPTPACATDGDCEVGETCTSAVCVPTSTCVTDAMCGAGQVCDFRGTCVPRQTGACRNDADCSGGKVCVEGSCRATGIETCQFDLECGPAQVCIDSKCVNRCSVAGDCGSGEMCTGGRCVVDPTECLTSADCSGNAHCVGGRCLAGCSGNCSDADDVCDVDGFCRPDWRPAAFCDSDQDCAVGSRCELATGICRVPCDPASPLVTGYTGSSCSGVTADCACQTSDAQFVSCGLPAGADDYCRTASELASDCETGADCASNQQCVNGRCE